MAGVGTLLKQAQKMQKQIESMQASLEAQIIDVSSGGGAVQIKINGAGKFQALTLGADFLKEDKKLLRKLFCRRCRKRRLSLKKKMKLRCKRFHRVFRCPVGFDLSRATFA